MPGCEEPEILTGYFHASQGVEERFQTMPDETALYAELKYPWQQTVFAAL